MKQHVNVTDYAKLITEMLPRGILLNTSGEKFNSMVIGWGGLGTVWGLPAFTVYVRESRYTKELLDKSGEFSISIPLERVDPLIQRVCGSLSGRDIDKEKEAGLILEEPELIKTPGVRQYPLTLECRLLYRQKEVLADIPAPIRSRYYPEVPGTDDPDARDPHTAYIGQIVAAYIIE